MPHQATEPLVTREKLDAVIESVKTDPSKHLESSQELYLRERWAAMVMWWHSRSVKARWKYLLLRAIVVVGGVLIPVLSTLSMRPGWSDRATIAIACVGALVAASAAWEGVANYGEVWREKRRAAELLKVEGWLFLQLCGRYEVDKELKVAFPRFVNEVETKIATEVGEYLSTLEPSVTQAQKVSAEILSAIVEEARKKIVKP